MSCSGSCVCGAVQVTVSGEPQAVRQCWCHQCQQLAAGGPTHNAIFDAGLVNIGGQLASSSWLAGSGNTLTFHFCPACGTQIYAQSSARPHLKTMRLGVLGMGHGLKPQMVIWTADAPDWAQIDPALPQFAGKPPAPLKAG